jgi:hypothetical protein
MALVEIEYRALGQKMTWVGDKTAYLVTDSTVTAVTIIKESSGILGKYLSRSKCLFFNFFYRIHGHRDSYDLKMDFNAVICHAIVKEKHFSMTLKRT